MALTTELNELDGDHVDDLELFGLGEAKGGKVFREPLANRDSGPQENGNSSRGRTVLFLLLRR